MELRHLRYFVAVAEELSFTRAAERLHIGQPPLSHAIQVLEADVGAQLFERTKRSVRLTGAGALFLADARRILALAAQATDTARRAQRGEAGELRIGFTFSTIARSQLQAMQLTFFFFLPSMLLSGFMFPFRGMPQWAQTIGEVLPLTHFLRLVRGILLKGNTLPEVAQHLWPIALFALAAALVALRRFRRTLD